MSTNNDHAQNGQPPQSEHHKTVVLKHTTVELYKSLANRVNRRTRLQLQESPEDPALISPLEMVQNWRGHWLKSVYTTICLERSAMLWTFKNEQPFGWQEALSALERMQPKRADFNRNENSIDDEDTVSTRRTRPPGRMIPQEHFNALIQTLGKFRITGQQTQWFLFAGVASGARPIEWHSAKWIDEQKGVLRLFNAKVKIRNAWDKIPAMTFTAEDIDGEMEEAMSGYRSKPTPDSSWYAIDFSRRISDINLTAEEQAELESARYLNGVELFRDVQIEEKYKLYVSLHLESVQNVIEAQKNLQANWPAGEKLSDEQIFTKFYYGRIRHCLWRASKAAFNEEETYSLVDTRSTFASNRKGRLGLREAAAELGHTATTSRLHYAPASKAWSQYKPVHGNTKKTDDQQNDANADGKKEGDSSTVVPGQAISAAGLSTPASAGTL